MRDDDDEEELVGFLLVSGWVGGEAGGGVGWGGTVDDEYVCMRGFLSFLEGVCFFFFFSVEVGGEIIAG